MAELNNLDQLTEKIYLEGVSKAEKESKNILSNADKEQKQLLDNARQEAEKIITQAKREADRLARSVEKELHLKGKQFISDLQQEIQNLLSEKIIEKGVKGAFADDEFTKSAIMEALRSWNQDSGLELVLPQKLEKKLKDTFQKSLEQHTKNLTITFNGQLSGGFRIGIKGGTYQISYTEQDFIHLFQPYLSSQTQKLLFRKS